MIRTEELPDAMTNHTDTAPPRKKRRARRNYVADCQRLETERTYLVQVLKQGKGAESLELARHSIETALIMMGEDGKDKGS